MKKITITPEQAREWLEQAEQNRERRPLNQQHVEKLAKEMREGRWEASSSGTPIVFTVDGRILDGLHRIAAVVEAGVPNIMFTVIEDWEIPA